MPNPIVGLHHVTAIASDPQTNLDFYTEVLGLRFVKRTVNFDDPGSYHFYFGDDSGSPGTILTFFPRPKAARGTPGIGEVTLTAFSVPLSSIDFWAERLSSYHLPVERSTRFNETVLTFPDPDGMKIEIVGHANAVSSHAPRYASVPVEHAICGFYGVTPEELAAAIEADLPIYRAAVEANTVTLGVDYNVDSPLNDLEDVTRVKVSSGKIEHIGKVMRDFNAIDTGVFLCTPAIFAALEASQAAGDDSISGAMNVLARQGKARVFDVQGRLWLDVDDPASFDKAEELLGSGRL